jgi:hypothetical protein
VRVANFHSNTIKATVEMMESCGFENISEINVSAFFRKIDQVHSSPFSEIYETERNIMQSDFINN